MKFDSWVSTQPPLEGDDTQGPAERKARDSNGDIEEHHDI
jgi:hypothetical protein